MAMANSAEKEAWSLDQLAKSEFFHQKLHEWGLLEVASQVERVKGEAFTWDREELGIAEGAWDRVIHRGIKPIVIFAHPQVLMSMSRAVSYYRMLTMVSQKSMKRVRLNVDRYEQGNAFPDEKKAWAIAQHLNRLISRLVKADEKINAREFDLWRGMAAGSQAQGSWQNTKGSRIETVVKGVLRRRLRDRGWASPEETSGSRVRLTDGRIVVFADEPDVGVYREERIVTAIEIKGGIDQAGVLERVGAAIKSLRRAKESNPESITVLVLQGVSVTRQAIVDLKTNQGAVNY